MSDDDKPKANKFNGLLAALRKRYHGDQTPGEYYRPPPIFHSAFVPPGERPNNWIRPRGPRKDP